MDTPFGALLLIVVVGAFTIVLRHHLSSRARTNATIIAWFGALVLCIYYSTNIYPLFILALITLSLCIKVLREKNILHSRFWSAFHM